MVGIYILKTRPPRPVYSIYTHTNDWVFMSRTLHIIHEKKINFKNMYMPFATSAPRANDDCVCAVEPARDVHGDV